MGSGHFLVAAVDRIEARLSGSSRCTRSRGCSASSTTPAGGARSARRRSPTGSRSSTTACCGARSPAAASTASTSTTSPSSSRGSRLDPHLRARPAALFLDHNLVSATASPASAPSTRRSRRSTPSSIGGHAVAVPRRRSSSVLERRGGRSQPPRARHARHDAPRSRRPARRTTKRSKPDRSGERSLRPRSSRPARTSRTPPRMTSTRRAIGSDADRTRGAERRRGPAAAPLPGRLPEVFLRERPGSTASSATRRGRRLTSRSSASGRSASRASRACRSADQSERDRSDSEHERPDLVAEYER